MIPRLFVGSKLLNCVAATVLVVVLTLPQVVLGADLSFPVGLSHDKISIKTVDGVSKVNVAERDYYQLMDEGLPALPFRIVNVLLPQGEEIDKFEFETGRIATVAEGYNPEIAPPAYTYEGETAKAVPLTGWSQTGTSFPASAGKYLGTGYYHGYAIASFAVFPLSVAGGDLKLVEDVTLRISTRPRTSNEGIVTRERFREGFRRKINDRVEPMVINPSGTSGYAFNEVIVDKKHGGFQPTSFPSLEGSPVDFVIITNDSLAGAYQTLADWRTNMGIPTVIRTTEWIEANYRNGVDIQETIRTFITDAYTKWGISYVLLGGDTDQIPPRLAHSNFYDEEGGGRDLPVDMYYVCLDGNWNADGDHIFGERPTGLHPDEDFPDLYAELNVGRLPTTSVEYVNLLVNKIISYETPVNTDYVNKVLFLAEVLFPIGWQEGQAINMNGADLAQFIYLVSMTDPSIDVVRLYETEELYPGSIHEDKATAMAHLNSGYSHVCHVGHGFRFNMSVGDGSILNWDADGLINTDRYGNYYLLNCTAVAYTYYCLAEHILKAPLGGGVSVVGSNESAFPNAANYYMSEYYDLIFRDSYFHIGEAFTLSRIPRTPLALVSDNVDLWTHYIYTILADPTLAMWTRPVDVLQVSYPSAVNMGTNTIQVTVNSGGLPEDSVLVCLSKGTDDYQYGVTDALGQVTFDFRAESPGAIKVVATGLNHARYEGSITVNGTSGAYVSLNGMTVDDDNAGGTSGNGDGVIDAGETVDLTFQMVNSGTSASGSVTLKLWTGDAGVVVSDSLASVGVVPGGGGTKWATDPVRVVFSPGIADETAVAFNLVVRQGGIDTWEDAFSRLVHAPILEKVKLRIDDTASGNGNGIVNAGELFDLYYEIKNFGTGTAYGLTAALEDLEDGFVFTDSTDTYPPLPPVTGGENANGFLIKELLVSTEHDLEITITDAYGRVYADTFELRPPVPPTGLATDPKLGPDRLLVTWTASASADVARYNVYQSENTGGPYSLINVDPVDHPRFLDRGLQSSTIYYYAVTAIDKSGNESVPSAEQFGSTNPGQIEGWPIVMGAATVSSPVIGDIDGDGDLEIVATAEYVYAWHHDGSELVNGDGDAQTWGVLTTEGFSFVSHPALASIDGKAGLDIVAASRDTKEVYVFNYNGDVVTGWPRSVENYIRAAVVVGDINADAILEIVAIDERGVLYVWNRNGTEYRDGDSNPATQGVFKRLTGCTLNYSAPAIADIDGDLVNEIVVGTQGDSLYVFNDNGTRVPPFPVGLGADITGSPAIGDVDDNGTLEIVVNTSGGMIRAIRNNGTNLWSKWFPNGLFFGPSPALGDITGNGKLEAACPSSNGNLYVIKSDGSYLTGWPVQYSDYTYTESSPIMTDMDGDGSVDVLLGDESQYVKAWNASGNLIAGFPLGTGDAMRGVPAADDIDGDGDVDLVAAGWDQNVYVWDFKGSYNSANSPWPNYHGNRHNDGLIGSVLPTGIAGVTFTYELRRSGLELSWILPASAGYLFDVKRASLAGDSDVDKDDFELVVSQLPIGADGVLRYVDAGVEMGTRYVYRMEASGDPTVNYTTGAIYITVTQGSLEQNYPNPFNPATRITFLVPDGHAQHVSLVVYDVRGARVKTLVDGLRGGGRYTVEWDGRNNTGERVASGVYFYRLVEKNYTHTKKMLLLK